MPRRAPKVYNQKELLHHVAQIVADWDAKGMPKGSMIRIWIPGENADTPGLLYYQEVIDISEGLLLDVVDMLAHDWLKDIHAEIRQNRRNRELGKAAQGTPVDISDRLH